MLYKGKVAFRNEDEVEPITNFNIELCLTNLNVILTVKLENKEVNSEFFSVDTIKSYKNEVQAIRKDNLVEIYFQNHQLCLEFPDKKEAKLFVEEVTKLISGNNKFVRNILKMKKTFSDTGKALDIDSQKVTNATKSILGVVGSVCSNNAVNMVSNTALNLLQKNTKSAGLSEEQIEQLTKLKEQLDKGIISQDDYEDYKKQILNI